MSSTLCRFCQQEILMARTGPGEFDFVPLDPEAVTAVYAYDEGTKKGIDPKKATSADLVFLADHRRTCEVLRSAEFKYLNDETRGRLLEMVMSIEEDADAGAVGLDCPAFGSDAHYQQIAETLEAVDRPCRDCPHPISNHPEVAGETFCNAPGCSCFGWRS